MVDYVLSSPLLNLNEPYLRIADENEVVNIKKIMCNKTLSLILALFGTKQLTIFIFSTGI